MKVKEKENHFCLKDKIQVKVKAFKMSCKYNIKQKCKPYGVVFIQDNKYQKIILRIRKFIEYNSFFLLLRKQIGVYIFIDSSTKIRLTYRIEYGTY
jgi:hypothetical protein